MEISKEELKILTDTSLIRALFAETHPKDYNAQFVSIYLVVMWVLGVVITISLLG